MGTSIQRTYRLISPGEQETGNLSIQRAVSESASQHYTEFTYGFSRCQIGNNWYFKGVGIFSQRGWQWISEGAGQRVFLENFNIFGNLTETRSRHAPIATLAKIAVLPPEATSRYLCEVFLRSKVSIVFPFLERKLFEGTIARAYGLDLTSLESKVSAESCIWAMLACVPRTKDVQQFEGIPAPDQCAQEVKRLLILTNGAVYLDSLEAILLLVRQLLTRKCRDFD